MEDDCEMECDFIRKPSPLPPNCEEPRVDQNIIERPVTPPNNMSMASSICSPLSNIENDCDMSFIRRVGMDRLHRDQRFTSSTPLFMNRPKFSNTLPIPNTTSHLKRVNDLRSCKSVENIMPLNVSPEQLFRYINPFTPDAKLANKAIAQKQMKRLNIDSVRKLDLNDSSEPELLNESDIDVPNRPRLSEFNVSRFNEEFIQLEEVGKGDHGCVYKCLNRINGCVYAIKRTIKPIRSGSQESIIRNEIYAHGILDHSNIVRNFSCWKEEGFVFIQNEFCNGGSLEEYLKTNVMSEEMLRSLLLQMAHALRYIHNKGLAHMDVKPGNIMLTIDKHSNDRGIDSTCSFSDKSGEITFKLGDLGHITKLDEKHDVEEGDCRYLPREILSETYNYLDKADIFSLGLTVYEAAGGGPLPKNGDEWQEIRNGNLKNFEHLSEQLNSILKAMVQPSPENRPSPLELIQMFSSNSASPQSDEVFGYMRRIRQTKTVLEHKVEATGQYLRVLYKSHKQLKEQLGKEKFPTLGKEKLTGLAKKKGGVTKSRIIGKKTTRSSSTTLF